MSRARDNVDISADREALLELIEEADRAAEIALRLRYEEEFGEVPS